MMTDPIADMLTRIRNANAVEKATVTMPSTKVKLSIAEVLKREGFIADFTILEKPLQNDLEITLKYGPEGEKVIQKIDRFSSSRRSAALPRYARYARPTNSPSHTHQFLANDSK